MSKTRQPAVKTRRGLILTETQAAKLAWLCGQEDRTQSNMIGRLIDLEYERRNGPPLDSPPPAE